MLQGAQRVIRLGVNTVQLLPGLRATTLRRSGVRRLPACAKSTCCRVLPRSWRGVGHRAQARAASARPCRRRRRRALEKVVVAGRVVALRSSRGIGAAAVVVVVLVVLLLLVLLVLLLCPHGRVCRRPLCSAAAPVFAELPLSPARDKQRSRGDGAGEQGGVSKGRLLQDGVRVL